MEERQGQSQEMEKSWLGISHGSNTLTSAFQSRCDFIVCRICYISVLFIFYVLINYFNIITVSLFLKYYFLRQYKFLHINYKCNLALMKPA